MLYFSLELGKGLDARSLANRRSIREDHVLYKLILILNKVNPSLDYLRKTNLYHHAHDFYVVFADKGEVGEFLGD